MKLLLVVMLVASVAGEDHEPQVHSPTNLTVNRTALDVVDLDWKAPLNETPPVKGYLVYCGISETDIKLFDKVENTSHTHATISGVFTLYSDYQFYVTAFGDEGTRDSDPSNIVNVSMDIPQLSEEYNVTSDFQTITISWHSPWLLPDIYDLYICCKTFCANYSYGYIIDPPDGPGPENTSVAIERLAPNAVCFINLTAEYNITAVFGTNENNRSNTLAITEKTNSPNVSLPAPMKLRVVSATNTSLKIIWSHPACLATGYNLTYGNTDGYDSKLIPYTYETSKDCIPKVIDEVHSVSRPPPTEDIQIDYTLKGLEPCTKYNLSIAAVNETGMSDFSSTVNNMTAGPCPTSPTPPPERSDLFQVKFGRVQHCTLWSRERTKTLKKDLEATIVEVIKNQCNCTFEQDFFITDGSFSCYHCTGEATYRAKIETGSPPGNLTAYTYVDHLESWAESGSAFFVSEKRKLFINYECPVPIFSFADPECKTKKRPPCCNH